MLTVDYDRLGLRAGDRLLDLGCGGGRHAFEALRRGARVIALDRDQDELFDALTIIAAMEEAGPPPAPPPAVTPSRSRSPTPPSTG